MLLVGVDDMLEEDVEQSGVHRGHIASQRLSCPEPHRQEESHALDLRLREQVVDAQHADEAVGDVEETSQGVLRPVARDGDV